MRALVPNCTSYTETDEDHDWSASAGSSPARPAGVIGPASRGKGPGSSPGG